MDIVIAKCGENNELDMVLWCGAGGESLFISYHFGNGVRWEKNARRLGNLQRCSVRVESSQELSIGLFPFLVN